MMFVLLIAICGLLAYIAAVLRRIAASSEKTRAFDALYPVFTREAISRCVTDLRRAEDNFAQNQRRLHAHPDFKPGEADFPSKEVLEIMTEHCSLLCERNRLTETLEVLVNGNAAVLRGDETIASAKKRYSEVFGKWIFETGHKQLEEWLLRLQNENAQKGTVG